MLRSRVFILVTTILFAGCATVPPQVHKVLVNDQLVSEASEQVQVIRAGVSSPVNPGTTLETGDIVKTGPGSQAVLLLENGAVEIVMLENTEIRISSVWVEIGEIFVRVKKSLREVFEVESEYGVAGVEGTVFTVRVQPGQTTADPYECITLEGQVQVRSASNAWSPVRLRAGEAVAASSTTAQPKRTLDRREFNNLINRINRVERNYRPGATELLVPNVVGLTQAEAKSALGAQRLSMDTPVRRVTGNAPIGQVITQQPVAGSRIEPGAAVSLEVEAEPTTVPGLVGAQEQSVARSLARSRLKKGEVAYEITGNEPQGEVLRQQPKAGTVVPVESAVDIWVEAESVRVPQLANLTLNAARSALSENRLVVGSVSEKLVQDGAVNRVIEQSVAANTPVAPGSRVDLVVSIRGIAVPNLINRSADNAESALDAANLNLGRSTSRRSTALPGRVIEQDPDAGELLKAGESVDIVTESGCYVPSVTNTTRANAEATIRSAGFSPSIRSIGTYSQDYVTGQQPTAGGPVRCGTTVYLDLGTNIG